MSILTSTKPFYAYKPDNIIAFHYFRLFKKCPEEAEIDTNISKAH